MISKIEYYVCYNALYSLLVKCGIKCEIHDCNFKLMFLFDFDKKLQERVHNSITEELRKGKIVTNYMAI